jgi:hypothetical protein
MLSSSIAQSSRDSKAAARRQPDGTRTARERDGLLRFLVSGDAGFQGMRAVP